MGRANWKKRPDLVRLLVEHFGQQAVRVCTTHHVQVTLAGCKHDLWFTDSGQVKYRLFGQGGGARVAGSLSQIIEGIEQHSVRDTDLGRMKEAWETAQAIDDALVKLRELGLQQAVFCDAGVKDGVAKMGWIWISKGPAGPSIAARVWYGTQNINAAEREAVAEALTATTTAAPPPTIYSDSKHAVEYEGRRRNNDRVQWLPRHRNRAADRLVNLRGVDGQTREEESTPPWENTRGEELPGEADPRDLPGD